MQFGTAPARGEGHEEHSFESDVLQSGISHRLEGSFDDKLESYVKVPWRDCPSGEEVSS